MRKCDVLHKVISSLTAAVEEGERRCSRCSSYTRAPVPGSTARRSFERQGRRRGVAEGKEKSESEFVGYPLTLR